MMTYWKTIRIFLTIGFIAVAAFGASCSRDEESMLNYELGWRWDERVTFAEDSVTIINDLGYEVVIEQGYLVSASQQLIECEAARSESRGEGLLTWFGPSVAYAGHGDGEVNPTALTVPMVEDLLVVGENRPVGSLILTDNELTYCDAHYLIAFAVDSTLNLPADVDMLGQSLYLAGTVYPPDSSTPSPLLISSNFAWGQLQTLTTDQGATTLQMDTDHTILFERDLSAIFDGIAFETMDEEEQAMAILRSLTDNVVVRIASED